MPETDGPPIATVEFLLQEHRTLLGRSVDLRIWGRAMFMLVIGFAVTIPTLSTAQLAATILVATLLSFLWFVELGSIQFRLYTIQEMLARRSPGEWEDFYIRTHHYSSVFSAAGGQWLRAEPLAWLIVTVVVAVLRRWPVLR